MDQKIYVVEYHSNNSGGSWWLSDEDWKRLEDAGWYVEWGNRVYCNSKWGNFGSKHEAPGTCPPNECPGHRATESYDEMVKLGKEYRYMGALSTYASIEVKAYNRELAEGVAELWWQEALPTQRFNDEGCNCCGRPHSLRAEEKK